MNRLSIIQSLYQSACDEIRSGNPTCIVNPVYFSIFADNIVTEFSSGALSIAGDPIYQIICTRHPYTSYGRTYIRTNLYCYLKQGILTNGIRLNRWTMENISFGDGKKISSVVFSCNSDTTKKFEFSYYKYQFKSQYALKIQDIWTFFDELDVECTTIEEAEMYSLYFLKKCENTDVNLSLEDYKTRLSEEKDLVKEYQTLLDKIKELLV